ncbi:MAG: cation transporter, partial [Candidatus Margulisbacteria bacterium]|nr:cation transporter [Candidatus Margulisiibacteriota bacterium]
YGYQRFSLMGAFINAGILIGGGLLVLSKAIPRVMSPEPTQAVGMMGFALLGIFVNGVAAYRLRQGRTMNEKMVTWHLMEDVLGWVAILFASIVIYYTQLYILDPILSILITVYILFNALKNVRETIRIFLQGTPLSIEKQKIEKEICGISGVSDVHDLRVWSLDGGSHIMSLHLRVDDSVTQERGVQIKQQVRSFLTAHHVDHVTIEVEYSQEECDMG